MSNKTIRSALEGHLKAWADAQSPKIPLYLENRSKVPGTKEIHLRADLMPADTLNPSEGPNHRRYIGLYQISILMPANNGTGDSDEMAAAIEELFRVATVIQKNGINVRITQTPSIAQSRPDEGGFWMTPVTVKYSAEDFS